MSESTAVTVNEKHEPRQSGVIGKIFLVLVLLVLAGVSAVSLVSYFRLSRENESLLQSMNEVKQQAISNQQANAAMQKTLTDMQRTEAENQKKNENANWPVAESLYLIKLANHYLQMSHDTQRAYLLLQSASDIMQQAQAPNLDPLRQSLQQNLSSFATATPDKTEEIYLQMATIYNQLDNLQLRPEPLQAEKPAPQQQSADSNLPWWKTQWNKTLEALSKVVIVRYTTSDNLPVVMPEEKMFLYQNLHAQMEDAMTGLLHQNKGVYQVSLARLNSWINRYFVPDAPLTQTILQQIAQLQQVNLQPPAIDLNNTVQLYSQYLAQNK